MKNRNEFADDDEPFIVGCVPSDQVSSPVLLYFYGRIPFSDDLFVLLLDDFAESFDVVVAGGGGLEIYQSI